ncbi:MAG: FHA domain-containing protein [Pseudomonadaceae bacterium]
MELTLEVIYPPRHHDEPALQRTFKAAGGVIGRNRTCDWVLEDPSRILSGQHAEVSFDQQRYQLTDLSRNGIVRKDNNQPLPKGAPVNIEHGHIYRMGEFEILARLHGAPEPIHTLIPDDAFLGLASDQTGSTGDQLLAGLLSAGGDQLDSLPPDTLATEGDHHHIEAQHVRLPRHVTDSPPRHLAADNLAEQICQRLGLECDPGERSRQHALQTASLLRVLVAELQQCLRNQHQLDVLLEHSAPAHPWCHNDSPERCLEQLLQNSEDAGTLLRNACQRLRAQTLAMQQANQICAERLPQLLSPHQLSTSLGPLRTDGARWRALGAMYAQQPDFFQQRYRTAFQTAYQEQARLLDSLQPHHG